MRPQPSDDAVQYEAEVTVKFYFTLEADDDMQASELATYEWQDNLFHGEIRKVVVDMVEEEEEDDGDILD